MRINHFFLAASISFTILFAFSCSSSDDNEGDNISSSSVGQSSSEQSSSSSFDCEVPAYDYDSFEYEGKTYRTIVIGDQTWLAENLDIEEGGKCYNDNPANCEKYGRLYTWAAAMALPEYCNSNECKNEIETPHRGICPLGWHIPDNAEWMELLNFAGGIAVAGTHLKATSCWNKNGDEDGNGQDTHKFAALPGCYGNYDGSFSYYDVGYFGYWWSSEEFAENGTYNLYMKYNTERAALYLNPKDDFFSVRCVQDSAE